MPAQSGLMLSGASGAMGCMHVRRVGLSSVSLRLGMSMGLRLGVGVGLSLRLGLRLGVRAAHGRTRGAWNGVVPPTTAAGHWNLALKTVWPRSVHLVLDSTEHLPSVIRACTGTSRLVSLPL